MPPQVLPLSAEELVEAKVHLAWLRSVGAPVDPFLPRAIATIEALEEELDKAQLARMEREQDLMFVKAELAQANRDIAYLEAELETEDS